MSRDAKKPKKQNFSADHPMRKAGFMHELEVMEFFGITEWTTWLRYYRTQIAGITRPAYGRIYHETDVLAFYHGQKTQNDTSADRKDDS